MFLKEEKYPPRKETSSLYSIQNSSFLFVGMWVCKSSKIKPEVEGAFFSRAKGDLILNLIHSDSDSYLCEKDIGMGLGGISDHSA